MLRIIKDSHHEGLLLVHRFRKVRPRRYHTRQIVELNARSTLEVPQTLKDHLAQIIDLIARIFVLNHLHREVDFLLVAVTLVEGVVFGNIVIDLHAQSHSGFVGPAPRHIFNRVSASAHHHRGYSKTKHELKALRMSLDAEIELA